MPKFLKAVRLDDSDAALYGASNACDADEWVTTGGFAVCDLSEGFACNPRCYCEASFLSMTRRARVTIAEVVEVDASDLALFTDQMAQHLLFAWKAPSYEAAREIAEEEINYTAETAAGFANEAWITVKRTPGADGVIDEQYDQYQRLMIGAHQL